jgi:hypothetical protein
VTGIQGKPRAHTVLTSADDRGFSTLRHSGPPRAARYALGRQLRRSAPRSALAGYLGSGLKVREALGRFARAYADQTERDHADLLRAVQRGVLSAETGI